MSRNAQLGHTDVFDIMRCSRPRHRDIHVHMELHSGHGPWFANSELFTDLPSTAPVCQISTNDNSIDRIAISDGRRCCHLLAFIHIYKGGNCSPLNQLHYINEIIPTLLTLSTVASGYHPLFTTSNSFEVIQDVWKPTTHSSVLSRD